MPSSAAVEALQAYRQSRQQYADYERVWRELVDYSFRDAELTAFMTGSKWDDDRPLTLAEANISEATVEDGYELYKGQLRRKT